MKNVWFVTGAARGFGAEIAKAALGAGHRVIATGRNADAVAEALGSADELLVERLDVTHPEEAVRAVRSGLDRYGRIDVLVNNAGYGQLGVFEETSLEDIRAEYETNLFGLMNVTRAVLPSMRTQRSGRIMNLSSVAGIKGMFAASIYCSSKFAVEGFSEALAAEVEPFGIKVISIAPGYFRTDFLDTRSVKYADQGIADYAPRLAEYRKFHADKNHAQPGDPAKLAQVMLTLSEIADPPATFIAGSDAVQWADEVYEHRQREVDTWRALSESTDGIWGPRAPKTSRRKARRA